MSCKYLSVPMVWDENQLKEILALPQLKDVEIREFYGVVSNGVIPTGRANSVISEVDNQKALYLREKFVGSFDFAYLLNAPICLLKDETRELEAYLDWIVAEFGASSLTISSYELMKFVRKRYPSLKINVSTIAGVKNEVDFNKYLEIIPSRIILHHDCVRDISRLRKLITLGEKNDIEIELMVNESCLNHCSMRSQHYAHLAQNKSDDQFHHCCNFEKIRHPYQLLYANFIRPEDLDLYSEYGITQFKVTGRSKPSWWLKDVLEAYLQKSYTGNLIRLLGIDPKLNAEDWLFINNSRLDGLAKELISSPYSQKQICSERIKRLYTDGDFVVKKSGVKYYIDENNCLTGKLSTDIYS